MRQRFSMLKQPYYSMVNQQFISYPTPSNLSFFWGMGPWVGICIVLQLVSGFCLSMHHTPNIDLAFTCVETLMRQLDGGWLLRYLHSNGASMILAVVHLHLVRGLYHGSYFSPREWVRVFGVVLLLLLMATAFTGYVLPWGQMSFWGATVITSVASAIPVVGQTIVSWLWGGFSVDNPTLTRFYSMHHLVPFILVGASLIHLAALHQFGSNNPLGVFSEMDKIGSFPYFYVKDLLVVVCGSIVLALVVCFSPTLFMHPDNSITANPLPTPTHIVPEWYFLPLHSLLRSIPSKVGGVAAIALVFFGLFALAFCPNEVRSCSFRPIAQVLFWLVCSAILLLGWIGCQPVEYPYVPIGQMTPLACLFISTMPGLAPILIDVPIPLGRSDCETATSPLGFELSS